MGSQRVGHDWATFTFTFNTYLGFPGGAVVKNPPVNVGDTSNVGFIPESGRSPGGGNGNPLQYSMASLVAQTIKNLPALWETWVWSLDWEEPLEKETATPIFLPGESPRTELPGRIQSMRLQRVGHNWMTFSLRSYKLGILEDFLKSFTVWLLCCILYTD